MNAPTRRKWSPYLWLGVGVTLALLLGLFILVLIMAHFSERQAIQRVVAQANAACEEAEKTENKSLVPLTYSSLFGGIKLDECPESFKDAWEEVLSQFERSQRARGRRESLSIQILRAAMITNNPPRLPIPDAKYPEKDLLDALVKLSRIETDYGAR